MVTREQAMTEDNFHFGNCQRITGPRGGVTESIYGCRRSGKTQTWKTRPEDFRTPVKHGMYDHREIVPSNMDQFHVASECPLLDGADHSKMESHVARVQSVTIPLLRGREFYRVVCTCGFITREEPSPELAMFRKNAHLLASEETGRRKEG